MSDALHITVRHEKPEGKVSEGQSDKDWVRADVMLNGESVATGYVPNYGIYKQDKIAVNSAIAMAQIYFNNRVLCEDIRIADEVKPLVDGNGNEQSFIAEVVKTMKQEVKEFHQRPSQ